MSAHRGPRDRLAIILGLAGVHLNRYGPDARAVFEEIRAEAHAAIAEMGAEEREPKCIHCRDTGIFEFPKTYRGPEGFEPCCNCNEAAFHEWRGDKQWHVPKPRPLSELRSWLAARKAPGADGVRDDAPSKSRSVA